MHQLTTIAALVAALVTPAAARSRLVVLDRPTLACSDQQALEMALTLARLHEDPSVTPVPSGSYPNTKTIGITDVACFTFGAPVSFVTMRSTFRRTNSAAISAMRSGRPAEFA